MPAYSRTGVVVDYVDRRGCLYVAYEEVLVPAYSMPHYVDRRGCLYVAYEEGLVPAYSMPGVVVD